MRPTTAQILEFEFTHPFPFSGTRKARDLRRSLGIGPLRYSQLLNRAIDTPEGQAFAPHLVASLRRQRDARRITHQLEVARARVDGDAA